MYLSAFITICLHTKHAQLLLSHVHCSLRHLIAVLSLQCIFQSKHLLSFINWIVVNCHWQSINYYLNEVRNNPEGKLYFSNIILWISFNSRPQNNLSGICFGLFHIIIYYFNSFKKVPEDFISKENFDSLIVYLIPKKELQGRLITVYEVDLLFDWMSFIF